MSYILDALRKADAQRESDPARGIHAQPVRAAIGEPRPDDGYRAAFWVAAGAGVAVLAAAGWYLSRDSGTPPEPIAPARVVAAAPAAQPAPGMQPAPATAAPAPAAPALVAAPPPAPAAAVLPPPAVVAPPIAAAPPAKHAPPAAKPVPKPPAAASAATSRAVAASPPSAAPVPAARSAAAAASANAPATAVPAAAPASVADSVPPAAGLPPDAPKLAISGGVYSANVAQRMLIVNGQVFNEGSEIGPAVVLEEIKPKAAVVRFRGSRYTVSY